MMHASVPQFHSAPRAGFGLLGGSLDAPMGGRGEGMFAAAAQRVEVSDRDRAQELKGGMRYPQVIANEGPQGRTGALDHQRLEASRAGAGSDRGGRTP